MTDEHFDVFRQKYAALREKFEREDFERLEEMDRISRRLAAFDPSEWPQAAQELARPQLTQEIINMRRSPSFTLDDVVRARGMGVDLTK